MEPGNDPKSGARPGDLVFAAVFMVLAAVLLSQLGEQTKWVRKAGLFAQPRFWPAVGVIGMTLFGAVHLWTARKVWRRRPKDLRARKERAEVRHWLFAFEYVAWFLIYVQAVTYLGYLLSTVVALPLLAWRLGYRTNKWLGISALTGLGIVLLFKTFLQVKIPGGAIYELLPEVARNFMIVYF